MKRTGQSDKSFHFSTLGIKNSFFNHVMVGKPSFHRYFKKSTHASVSLSKQLFDLKLI